MKMDECSAERKGQRHGQARKKERIKETRYNKKYERCMTEEIPKYLGRESAKEGKMMEREEGAERMNAK
jgi:hypothetical protein